MREDNYYVYNIYKKIDVYKIEYNYKNNISYNYYVKNEFGNTVKTLHSKKKCK